jgi:hypothetical protein
MHRMGERLSAEARNRQQPKQRRDRTTGVTLSQSS